MAEERKPTSRGRLDYDNCPRCKRVVELFQEKKFETHAVKANDGDRHPCFYTATGSHEDVDSIAKELERLSEEHTRLGY
jgi:hypothetical protein